MVIKHIRAMLALMRQYGHCLWYAFSFHDHRPAYYYAVLDDNGKPMAYTEDAKETLVEISCMCHKTFWNYWGRRKSVAQEKGSEIDE